MKFNEEKDKMYVSEIFNNKKPVLSFEVFPPKAEDGIGKVFDAVRRLAAQDIDYMSVTYGAAGSTSKATAEIAEFVENEISLTSLAHLTCINTNKEDANRIMNTLSSKGIHNILALRGDMPKDGENVKSDFKYASELTQYIKARGDFCVGGACYPECHPDAANLDIDIENLKIKVDSGCDFLVTQMFFDNDAFYNFRDKLVKKGINVPVTAGIMPLTSSKQIEKMCVLSGGASMPSKFMRIISKYMDKPLALKQACIAYSIEQIIDLVTEDVDGIHLYTMNKPDVAEAIVPVITGLFKNE